jgi:hypothetical protein
MAVLGASLALAGACSSSNSQVKPDGAAGGGGVTITGTGGSSVTPMDCPARDGFTEASHLIVHVTWNPGLASMGGDSQIHVWGKTVFTVSGNTLTGTLQACGIVLPATTLNALGGGGMILIEVPDTTWDAPSMPRFPVQGTQTGWNVPSTINYSYAALIGSTMTELATGDWPAANTGVSMINDADGDMNPGLTSIPRSGTGYTLPPTSIAQTARVDKLYIVNRNASTVSLSRTTCDAASGPAMLVHIDNHVVGCHIMGASDCMPADANFVDMNRSTYTIVGASAQSKIVADTATCADVRAALPM